MRRCRRGHIVVGDNEYIVPGSGRSECRQCLAIRSHEYRRRKAEEAGRELRGPHGKIPHGHPKSERTQYRERALRGETQAVFRYPWNDRFFDEWSDAMAWLLGVIWSDGYLSAGNRVEVCSKDRDLIESIAQIIAQANGVRPKNGGRHWRIAFTSAHAAQRLRALGLVTAKSHIIEWPVDVPGPYEAAFVRGLIDGDGSVLLSKYRAGQQRPDLIVDFTSASEALALSFFDWCDRHGIQARHYIRHGVHRLFVRQQASLRALHALLYPQPHVNCLARKRRVFEAWMEIPRVRSGRPKPACQVPHLTDSDPA